MRIQPIRHKCTIKCTQHLSAYFSNVPGPAYVVPVVPADLPGVHGVVAQPGAAQGVTRVGQAVVGTKHSGRRANQIAEVRSDMGRLREMKKLYYIICVCACSA